MHSKYILNMLSISFKQLKNSFSKNSIIFIDSLLLDKDIPLSSSSSQSQILNLPSL